MGNGLIPDSPHQPVTGALIHDGPGRTDDTPIHVPAESFIVPADVISALGQGNTLAGFNVLAKLYPPQRAMGGAVPIVAAGGEYVISPDHVARIGGGDHKRGHGVLNEFVKHARREHIKTLRGLPVPVKS